MNPYEYETTLDCRDVMGADVGRGVGGLLGGNIAGGSLRHHPHHPQQLQQQHTSSASHNNTLQHQNQQNLQLQQQQQQQQQQSHYDYEYQHLQHRPPPPSSTANCSSSNSSNASSSGNSGGSDAAAIGTAARTHGRQGFLLEGVTPSAPPDVPPRNPTMSRMNNGRLVAGNPNDLGVDFEPSCLVRTPSGNVYIPSGNLNINKGSPIDYKSGSACSTPTKDTLKGYERSTNSCMGPVLPPRSVMSGIPTHHYSAPMNFRKDLAARCSAKCVAIVSISVFVSLCVLLIFLTGFGVLHWSPSAPCTVLVGNEASEVTAAKSTNTDLSKLHNSSLRSKTGQPLSTVTASTATSSLSAASAAAAAAPSSAFHATSASSLAAMGSAASSAIASSSSAISSAPSPSSSLSSSLANANNGDKAASKTHLLERRRQQQQQQQQQIFRLQLQEQQQERRRERERQQQRRRQQQQQQQQQRHQKQRYRRSLSAKAETFIDLITNEATKVNETEFPHETEDIFEFMTTTTSTTTTTNMAATRQTEATVSLPPEVEEAPTTESNYANNNGEQDEYEDDEEEEEEEKQQTVFENEDAKENDVANRNGKSLKINNVLNLNQSNNDKEIDDDENVTAAVDVGDVDVDNNNDNNNDDDDEVDEAPTEEIRKVLSKDFKDNAKDYDALRHKDSDNDDDDEQPDEEVEPNEVAQVVVVAAATAEENNHKDYTKVVNNTATLNGKEMRKPKLGAEVEVEDIKEFAVDMEHKNENDDEVEDILSKETLLNEVKDIQNLTAMKYHEVGKEYNTTGRTLKSKPAAEAATATAGNKTTMTMRTTKATKATITTQATITSNHGKSSRVDKPLNNNLRRPVMKAGKTLGKLSEKNHNTMVGVSVDDDDDDADDDDDVDTNTTDEAAVGDNDVENVFAADNEFGDDVEAGHLVPVEVGAAPQSLVIDDNNQSDRPLLEEAENESEDRDKRNDEEEEGEGEKDQDDLVNATVEATEKAVDNNGKDDYKKMADDTHRADAESDVDHNGKNDAGIDDDNVTETVLNVRNDFQINRHNGGYPTTTSSSETSNTIVDARARDGNHAANDNNNGNDLAGNYDDGKAKPTTARSSSSRNGSSTSATSTAIKVDKFKLNDRHKTRPTQTAENAENQTYGRQRRQMMEINEQTTATATTKTMASADDNENESVKISIPPSTWSYEKVAAATSATTSTADSLLDELMLNDGLIPLNSMNGFIDTLKYAQNLDDIDIVKLEQTEGNIDADTAHAHSASNEDELYKTIDQRIEQPALKVLPNEIEFYKSETTASPTSATYATFSPTSATFPPTTAPFRPTFPPAKVENEVLKLTEAETEEKHQYRFPPLKPHVSESYDTPGKRILVNLTIAADDDSGSVYTLHVAVPIGGTASHGSQNLEQVLTHERRPSSIVTENPESSASFVASPYCVPEPPPPIPDCPCKCTNLVGDNDDKDNDSDNDNDDDDSDKNTNAWQDLHVNDTLSSYVASTTDFTATSFTTTNEASTIVYEDNGGVVNDDNNVTAAPFKNDDEDNVATTDTITTTTTPIVTNISAATVNNDNRHDDDNDVAVKNGVEFACPDVMPILILEGARTFPARSFPPDGTTFGQITLGQKLTKEIQPYSYWNMQFYQSEPAYVKFDYTIPRGASIGVYGRRNALPTHTQYHFKEVLSGFSVSTRTARAAHLSITREVTRYMEPGHWFVSLYNDDGDLQEVTFYAAIAEDMTQNCPNGCSGNGQCLLGHCQCNPGFGGDDCSESVCPVLCSQHGEYINGECICNPGWKGKECSMRHDECEVADCTGHGHCVSGKCQCMRGYKGKFCEEVDCPHPTCSGHGFCADGTCICKKGWKGVDCATMDQDALQCLPDCSGHGTFDLDTQTCTCESKWSGDDCSKELCDLDCGQHGRCVGDACACDPDWGGDFCNTKLCDTRCNEHGQCKNGTCLCVTGWNGKHCTIEGCPNGCSAHGQCRVSGEGQWECRCYEGWDGPDCGIALELNCGDSKDNDKDGLVDCEDPECCASHVCKTSQLCVSAPKPIDVLLRKQPPAITASFFERMKFLIDESSLQNYAKLETFNESRSAVIRGRVVTSLGMGLVGVRVSTTTLLEGFTLTRDDGWFDLMVNGGGAVTLQFGRSPFRPQSRIVQVPWNEVVIIDVVIMSMSEEKSVALTVHTCFSHDYDLMKPVVLASWKHGFQGACPDRSAILAESQVIQESLQIPGTGLNLVYHSSRAAGYLSTIKLQLTPETIPESLHLIHLRITIEGILFERVFEADPGIKFTYAWNRLNIYRQRVYGVTTAVVKVGYQYTDCKDIVWDIQTTKLSGHDMSISEVGGWNLDIHHRYNFHEGILQKGDGSNIYLKNKPRVILTTMGDGHQRPLDCSDCEGLAFKQRLLAPVALASSPDGSLYVGDFNYIRRIMTDGSIRTVVKLNATRVSYRYHMALSPLDGTLYISDPESHQIIRVRDTNDYSQPEKNWEPIVGSGERCLPGDEAHCGDGALAKDAKLAYPKGIAISSENILYFADGTNIRMVDRDGIVTTLIGNHMHKSHWKPIPCEGTLKLEEMHLRWPTELSVSPLDNTLHIIDDHMILRMTPDGRVRVISGRPLHCASTASSAATAAYDSDLATHATLVMPQSIAFGPMGELYVAESDSQRINRVRVIGTDGRISAFAGAESKCNCLERGCDCFEAEHFLATSAKFNTIAALAVTPDGHVHIADQANYRIRSVMSSIPEASTSREYEIYAPDMQEIYIFNRFGQHVSTRNILTGETTYVFTYNVNTSNGKLSTVTDAAGNKVFLLRDYTSQVNSIENTKGQKCRLRMTRMKMLHELSTPDNYNVTFEYHGPTGLLKTKLDSTGRSYVYNYDEFGRLTSAVTPTGRVIDLAFDLSVKGALVKVSENAQKEISMLIQGSTVLVRNGEAESRTSVEMDGSTTSITPWGHTLQMEVVPYALLAEISPLIGESYPVPAKQRTEIAGDLANRFEWRYFVRRLPQQGKQQGGLSKAQPRPVAQVGRKLRVNGDNVLTLEYDRETQSVVVVVDDKQELLNVTYDRTARPVSFRPQSGDYADVDLEYDRFGRLVSWKWGVLQEAYTFDRNGRLNEIKYGDGSSMVYAFKDMFGSLPLKVTTPRRSDYLLQYDDAGALQSLTTPRGHIHAFSLQTSLGFFKYQYFSPINRHPFEILYNDEGQILAKIHPHQSGKVAFVHDSAGRLETILAGLSSTHYTYQETTSLIKSVEVQEPGFELRREFKYHAGILKDEKLRFGSKNSLASAHYKYGYDGNARLSGIEMSIDDKEMPTARYKYSQNLGQLEVVQDLKITRNAFNRTVIQDSAKQFFTIMDYDQHGRIKSVLMNIKSFDVFRLELDYDLRNRVKSQKTTFGRSTAFDKINYNADGHVIEVLGTNNWKYLYDENGNIVGVVDQSEKINLGYDIGDRVIQVGDIESNNYDARGFVVRRGEQKYRYNNRGQLIHAFERERFQTWYYYDDRSRLVAWHDSKGNVTQYYYANPRTPKLLTHVHFPKLGKTLRFYYDDRDMLIAIENAEQRFYVATDQNGSPLAFFDLNGSIVKEVKRTPFGRIIKDTNPEFFVPIDFHGGLLDPHTKLIYTERRQYDPTVGQWMTPLWETLATEMSNPTDVFIYRYHNNDPVNRNQPQNYMIDLESWLQLFGYDLRNMQSSKYTRAAQYTPQASIKSNTLAPDFGVISGLECIVEKTNEKFSDFDFVPKPLLKMEPKMRNLLPRVSYRRGVFGEGVLLSRIAGRAMVSVVDGSNSVVQDVVSSVFNNSHFLDLHFSIHDQDVFYFVKDNVLKLRDDNEELRRLGGMFNISTHEITDHGGAAAKELRLHGPDAVVIIKYGVDPEQERHRILKHAHKRAVERAWELEKQLVAAGFQGRGDWTEEEKEELVSHGDVDGWIGIDIHSIHKYPQLADDPGNVAFQRDAKRKRRKTGSGHRLGKSMRRQQQQQQKLMDLSA